MYEVVPWFYLKSSPWFSWNPSHPKIGWTGLAWSLGRIGLNWDWLNKLWVESDFWSGSSYQKIDGYPIKNRAVMFLLIVQTKGHFNSRWLSITVYVSPCRKPSSRNPRNVCLSPRKIDPGAIIVSRELFFTSFHWSNRALIEISTPNNCICCPPKIHPAQSIC